MSTVEHSITTHIVKSLADIDAYLTTDPGQAVKQLLKVMAIVEPAKRANLEDYPKIIHDAKTYIKEKAAISSPMEMNLTMKLVEYDIRHNEAYRDLYFRVWAVFWDCDYFDFNTFTSFHDPSGGRKSGDEIKYNARRKT